MMIFHFYVIFCGLQLLSCFIQRASCLRGQPSHARLGGSSQVSSRRIRLLLSTTPSIKSFGSTKCISNSPLSAISPELVICIDHGHDVNDGCILSLSLRQVTEGQQYSDERLMECNILQETDGPVPRANLPTVLSIAKFSNNIKEDSVFSMIEAALQWYCDCGGRVSRLKLAAPAQLSSILDAMGMFKGGSINDGDKDIKPPTDCGSSVEAVADLTNKISPSFSIEKFILQKDIYEIDSKRLRAHCMQRLLTMRSAISNPVATAGAVDSSNTKAQLDHIKSNSGNSPRITDDANSRVDKTGNSGSKFSDSCSKSVAFTLNDLLGRLQHDMGDPRGAIPHYTAALTLQPQSAPAFRNLGSAYHAVGDMQLAFASYQQAVQLDDKDALTYLKLAFFYEDFAGKDWPGAEELASKCYHYYLDHVDPRDTAILTRLANLLLKKTDAKEAVEIYNRVLNINEGDVTAWFNKAQAQVKIRDYEGAKVSLDRALALDGSLSAARHMLCALDEEAAQQATTVEQSYITGLFDGYAPMYDSHVKKLLYAAPRVIRQELATIYKQRYSTRAGDGTFIIDTAKIRALQKQRADENGRNEHGAGAGVGVGEGGIDMKESLPPARGSNPHGCESDTDTDFVDAADAAMTGVEKGFSTGTDRVDNSEMAAVASAEAVAAELAAAAAISSSSSRSTPTSSTSTSTPTSTPTSTSTGTDSSPETTTGVGSSCTTYTSFMNHTLDVLDLGCGTGQAGAWLKDYAASLTGVDMSAQMLAVARKKGLYRQLHHTSLQDFLDSQVAASVGAQPLSNAASQRGEEKGGEDEEVVERERVRKREAASVGPAEEGGKFDVVVAADVFPYVGELHQIFQQVGQLLRPQGLFAFTVEALPPPVEQTATPATSAATAGSSTISGSEGAESTPLAASGRGLRLLHSGRFGYSRTYLDESVRGMGPSFRILQSREFSPRLDLGQPVPGYLYIVQRD